MNSAYIYHHLGLGDHIIANGMVRTIAKKYDKIYLFCKPIYMKNVSFMYRDLLKIEPIGLDDPDVKRFMIDNPDNNYLIIGHDPFWRLYNEYNGSEVTKQIDEIFYEIAGVPLENKWTEFYVKRELKKEKEVFNKLGLKEGDKYAFVHDKENARIQKNIPDIKIIRADNPEFLIFDFIYTIENADEIHCVNSVFYTLIDCLKIQKDKMFLHEYCNKRPSAYNATMGCPWKILS